MGSTTSRFIIDRSFIWLLIIWSLQGIAIAILTIANPNHYTTVDSVYYLTAADNLVAGKGYLISENDELVWNGHFPPGYSFLIALFQWFFQITALAASKLVNWFSAGVLLLFIRSRNSNSVALAFGLFLCSGIGLKLWVHSWSEPLYICILLIWSHYFLNDAHKNMGKLLVLGCLLILVRYAGIFVIPVVVFYSFLTSCPKKTWQYFFCATCLSLAFLANLGMNYIMTGEPYGGSRFTQLTPIYENLKLFGLALLNESLLIRDLGTNGWDVLVISGVLLQFGWFYWMQRNKFLSKENLKDRFIQAIPYFKMAMYYLLFIFLVRLFSPFDAPGYRLMAPFTFLTVAGLLFQKGNNHNPRNYVPWIVMVILSWLHLIPS